ncbi:MAG: DNA adenine methylase [Planctomycetaceae bacterium]
MITPGDECPVMRANRMRAAMRNANGNKATTPILRWAGSKRQLLPVLSQYWSDEYDRYVEPFAGSCSLFLTLAPEKALIADKNEELMHTYRIVRRGWREVYDGVRMLPRNGDMYKRLRATDPTRLRGVERAIRFVYLNRNCFNGLYRTNRQGAFNVPYSSSRTGALPPADVFEGCARLLQVAHLRAWDFGTTLRYTSEGDFVYLDPPYAVETRRVFREYGPKQFSQADLGRLSDHLDRLDDRGVVFLLSYADCAAARKQFKKWPTRRIRVRRHIAGFQGARRHAFELLVSNRAHPCATRGRAGG